VYRLTWRLPLAGLVAFNHLQFSQIRGRQPYLILRKILYVIHGDITAHGFRSTFRDWAAERTTFAREVAEMALAHAIPDAVEAVYRRGDLFDKRRKLMDAWAAYCTKVETDAGKVVALARARTPR
jgi:integrase